MFPFTVWMSITQISILNRHDYMLKICFPEYSIPFILNMINIMENFPTLSYAENRIVILTLGNGANGPELCFYTLAYHC